MAKKGKKNVFSGRILEIEGLPDLKVEQAFELQRRLGRALAPPAAPCTLNKEPIIEYLNSNIALMKSMIADGYATRARWSAASRRWRPGWPTRSCSRPTRTPSTPP